MDMATFLVTSMEKLKEEMREHGITQAALADLMGLDRSYVNQMLNGRRKPPEDFEARAFLALVFLVEAEYEAEKARRRSAREKSLVVHDEAQFGPAVPVLCSDLEQSEGTTALQATSLRGG